MHRPLYLAIVCILALGAFWPPVRGADDGVLKAELRYQASGGLTDALTRQASRLVRPLTELPRDLEMPEGVSKSVHLFRQPFGARQVLLLLDTGKTPNTLYVDTDVDGSLADEKAVAGKPLARMRSLLFEDLALTPADGDDDAPRGRFLAARLGANYLILLPGGVMKGELVIGDEKKLVTLIDGNANGRYDDVIDFPVPGNGRGRFDMMGIDLNGDGKLISRFGRAAESQFLPRRIRIDDRWYAIDVAADGTSLTLTPVTPETGSMKFVGRVQAVFASDNGAIVDKSDDEGVMELPEGNYAVQRLTLALLDDAGATWTLSCRSPSKELQHIVVRPDKVTEVNAGGPLTVKPVVTRRGDRLFALNAVLVGRSGETYSPGVAKNGRRTDAPTFRIYDKNGKQVASGAFEYG